MNRWRGMEKQNVVLTGFMGTGKTIVGRMLAAHLGYGFVDTDELIVERDGRPISRIFQEDGEQRFREWESLVSRELCAAKETVIATGGGLMLDEQNARQLERGAHVFCLLATPEEIVARLANEKGTRPLLKVRDPARRIRQLLRERAKVYGRYVQISTSGRRADQIVEEIVQCISMS
jgi:shikimate kinase